jgi:hypothetical protein
MKFLGKQLIRTAKIRIRIIIITQSKAKRLRIQLNSLKKLNFLHLIKSKNNKNNPNQKGLHYGALIQNSFKSRKAKLM